VYFGVILEVMSSFGLLPLLLFLILVLISQRSLILALDLISLDSVGVDAVAAAVHVPDAYHLY